MDEGQVRRQVNPLRRLLAANGWAMAGACAASLAVVIGTYFGVSAVAMPRAALAAALAAAAMWAAIGAPAFAAGAPDSWGGVLRGGVVADAIGLAFAVLWVVARQDGEPLLTLTSVAECYCIIAAMAVFGIAMVCLARGAWGRMSLALAASVLQATALSSPFWTGGMLLNTHGGARGFVAAAAVYANPFYCLASAVVERVQFVWHSSPVMYHITRLGDYAAAPPAPWWSAAVIYGGAAVVLAGAAVLRAVWSRGGRVR